MSFGATQALADARAAHLADTLLSGSTNRLIFFDVSDTLIATANDIALADTANVVQVSSAGGASVGADGTIAGFALQTNGGATEYYRFKNTSYAIATADQSTGADTFTASGHGLSDGQALVVSDDIPTTAPAISDGDTVFATNVTTNTFQVERVRGEGAVDITTAGSTSTTFTAMQAVGTIGSGAVIEMPTLSVTNGQTLSINSFSITIPVYSSRAS